LQKERRQPVAQKKWKFLVACGTSIATTAIVVEYLKEELTRERDFNIQFYKCRTSDLSMQIEMVEPDIVITTAPVDPSVIEGVTYFKGIPFLTGMGADEIIEEIVEHMERGEMEI
jgi:PTS system galactitol-specific IIB component